MRRAHAVDANQAEIVATLRAVGVTVQILAAVGQGCPDLLVGRKGINVLLEVKDSRKPPSARRLTPDQQRWHNAWRGRVHVVTTVEQALAAVGIFQSS